MLENLLDEINRICYTYVSASNEVLDEAKEAINNLTEPERTACIERASQLVEQCNHDLNTIWEINSTNIDILSISGEGGKTHEMQCYGEALDALTRQYEILVASRLLNDFLNLVHSIGQRE